MADQNRTTLTLASIVVGMIVGLLTIGAVFYYAGILANRVDQNAANILELKQTIALKEERTRAEIRDLGRKIDKVLLRLPER